MKFWTIQTLDVIDIIKKDGSFYPDFKKSIYLNTNSKLENLYYFVLESFNNINHMDLLGVIFAFARKDTYNIYEIDDIDEFRSFIQDNRSVVDGFLKRLDASKFVIMELDYEEGFNPIFIEFNDFQLLMPPIELVFPYSRQSVDRILADIEQGRIRHSEFPTPVVQAHLPYIKEGNIVNIYYLSELF